MKVIVILCVLFRYVLSEETLLDCRNLCKCEFESRDTIVTCKGEHINEIPQDLPRNTTEL